MLNEINAYKASKKTYTITVTDEDGEDYDLSGWTVKFYAKQYENDDSYSIEKEASVTDAGGGIAELVLDSDDTDISSGDYFYQLKITKDSDVKIITDSYITIKESL